jgi:putative FmdB family regulatory protein
MPVYVYHCANCKYEFEQQQSFSDKPLKTCPECGQSTLHKVYTPVSVIYKGSGFYSTDHRSSSGSSYAASKKEETKSEEPKAEAPKTEKPKTEAEKTKSPSPKTSD